MKKNFAIITILLFTSFSLSAQWFPPNAAISTSVMRTGTVGIGYNAAPLPFSNDKLFLGGNVKFKDQTSYDISADAENGALFINGNNTSQEGGTVELYGNNSSRSGEVTIISSGSGNISFRHWNGGTWIEQAKLLQDGRFLIGENLFPWEPTGYKLIVEEGILTEKLKVALKGTGSWADYVFQDNYKLMPLEKVDEFVQENNHLPNVPSAEEMVKNGLDVAQMDAKLMEKIEELTLYLIEQNKSIKNLEEKIESLENSN